MVALTWYSLSYIPYGRQLFQRFILPVLKPVIKVVRAAFSREYAKVARLCLAGALHHNGSATHCVMAWIWFQFNTDVSMLCPTLLHLFLNAGVGDDAARVRLVLQALRALPAATMR